MQLLAALEWCPFLAGAYLLTRAVCALLDPQARYWPPDSRSGPGYVRFIWPFRMLTWGLVLVSLLAVSQVGPSIDSPRFWLGGVLLILGFGIAVHATLQLGWKVAFGQNGVLQKDGWLRFSRNPIYVATWIGLAGWALLLPKASILATVAVWAALYLPAIFLEERALAKTHGADYTDYKTRTARFLGWPRGRQAGMPT